MINFRTWTIKHIEEIPGANGKGSGYGSFAPIHYVKDGDILTFGERYNIVFLQIKSTASFRVNGSTYSQGTFSIYLFNISSVTITGSYSVVFIGGFK